MRAMQGWRQAVQGKPGVFCGLPYPLPEKMAFSASTLYTLSFRL